MQAQSKDSVYLPSIQLKRAILYIEQSEVREKELTAYKMNYAIMEKMLANRDSAIISLQFKDSINITYRAKDQQEINVLSTQRDISLNRIKVVQQQAKVDVKNAKKQRFIFGGAGILAGLILSIFIR